MKLDLETQLAAAQERATNASARGDSLKQQLDSVQ